MTKLDVDKCWVCPNCSGKPERWEARDIINGQPVVLHEVSKEDGIETHNGTWRGKFCINRVRSCLHCGEEKATIELDLGDAYELTDRGRNSLRELRSTIDGLLKNL